MLQVRKRTILTTCPFEDYLKLPGHSFSSIKNEGVEFSAPSKKMILGTHVHNYLLESEKYTYEDIEIVRPVAMELKRVIGPLFTHLLPEVAVTAEFLFEGLVMSYKGRGDLVFPGHVLIDIKVSEMPLHKSLEYFRYDRQVSGYAKGFDCRAAFIIQINPKTKKVTIYNVPLSFDWWEKQVLRLGIPVDLAAA